MDHLRRRLALITLAVALTLGGGTLGFVLIEHYPVFDAFHMTLTTVTTVGGEIHELIVMGESDRLQKLEQLLAGSAA